MANLNDTDAVILANAGGRGDLRVLPLPERLRVTGAAATKVLTKLVRAGLLASVAATAEDVVWTDSGRTTLVITDQGLSAIGIEAKVRVTAEGKSTRKGPAATKAATRAHSRRTSAKTGTGAAKAPRKASAARGAAKGLTKQQLVVEMLRRANGASIAELAHATDWQPHPVRGVLTATIKGRLGLSVVSERGEDGVRRYFVAPIATSKSKDRS